MSLTLNGAGTAISDVGVMSPSGEFSFSYDAAGSQFVSTNSNGRRNWPLGGAQVTNLPDLYPRVQFDVPDATERNILVLFKQCNCTPLVDTQTAAHGAWQLNRSLGADTRIRLEYFAYGTPTAVGTLPTTGTVSYRWYGTGNLAQPSRLFFTQEFGTMTVDFAARTVRISVSIVGADFLTGTTGNLALFEFDGTITGTGFEGRIVHLPSQTSGVLRGRFFGPDARDMGFVYAGTNLESSYVGAVTGTRF